MTWTPQSQFQGRGDDVNEERKRLEKQGFCARGARWRSMGVAVTARCECNLCQAAEERSKAA